jgi:Flp pilus assembly protein protease CpaA
MPPSPEYGTLVIAALLVLALVFAGEWIITYVQPGGNPTALFPWFLGAAAAILALGFIIYLRRGRGGSDR